MFADRGSSSSQRLTARRREVRGSGLSWIELLTPRHRVLAFRRHSSQAIEILRSSASTSLFTASRREERVALCAAGRCVFASTPPRWLRTCVAMAASAHARHNFTLHVHASGSGGTALCALAARQRHPRERIPGGNCEMPGKGHADWRAHAPAGRPFTASRALVAHALGCMPSLASTTSRSE